MTNSSGARTVVATRPEAGAFEVQIAAVGRTRPLLLVCAAPGTSQPASAVTCSRRRMP
jgi:hypothetical protein